MAIVAINATNEKCGEEEGCKAKNLLNKMTSKSVERGIKVLRKKSH